MIRVSFVISLHGAYFFIVSGLFSGRDIIEHINATLKCRMKQCCTEPSISSRLRAGPRNANTDKSSANCIQGASN